MANGSGRQDRRGLGGVAGRGGPVLLRQDEDAENASHSGRAVVLADRADRGVVTAEVGADVARPRQ